MTVPFTLGSLIDRSADRFGSRRLNFPGSGESVGLGDIAARATRIASGLDTAGLECGEIVSLLFPTSGDFFATFFGVLKAGGVPTAFPQPFFRSSAHVRRMGQILTRQGIRWLATSPAMKDEVVTSLPMTSVVTAADLEAAGSTGFSPRQDPRGLALVQFTSGSTSNPKGVALTHDNVRVGIASIVDAISLCENDVNGQWIPLHHDMGLIGCLAGISAGVEQHLWSPSEFLRRPAQWLESFANLRATIYAGPSFAYEYLLSAVPVDVGRTLDLSAWRVAFNGSEQVNASVMERFIARFRAAGLAADVMRPVYGMAEATLAVTIPEPGAVPLIHWVDRATLAGNARVAHVVSGAPGGRAVACVGRAVRDMELRVVDEGGNGAPDLCVGEIQIRGPAVMKEYLGCLRDAETFSADGWLCTGDLGYLDAGRLFVVGRRKEMIVVRGENHHPSDVEAAVQRIKGVHAGRCVAFAYNDSERERLVLLVETALALNQDRSALRERVRACLSRDFGVADSEVLLLKVNSILRTTSGKPQRLAMRALFTSGKLSAASWQSEGISHD